MSDLTVVFDLDGTLIDTAPDLIRSTNHVLEQAGYARVTPEFIRPIISFGTREMLRAGIRAHGETPTDDHLDRLFEALIDHYSENIAVESRPFPGLTEVLTRLRADGARIAICTNKREGLTRQLLDALDLAHHFDAITGRDTFPVHKPDPNHLLGAIRRAGGQREHAVMVGDSSTDVHTAKAAHVPVVGVTFGYTETPVDKLHCDAVISHYDEFLDALARVRPA
jgi:phosphoglycolate phosphatase